jgi:hypothetical protein
MGSCTFVRRKLAAIVNNYSLIRILSQSPGAPNFFIARVEKVGLGTRLNYEDRERARMSLCDWFPKLLVVFIADKSNCSLIIIPGVPW